VAVLTASALTMILIGRSDGPLARGQGAVRSVARAAFAPAEAAGAVAFRPLEAAVAAFSRGGDLVRARTALAGERERARSEAGRADALDGETRRLAALLHLDGAAAGEGVAARVVSIGGWAGRPVVLDRGAADGIRTGMPVVAAGGLVGRIVDVGPRHSTVLPVTDAASTVGVRAGAAGAAGVAQGLAGPVLRLDLLDPGAPLRSGEVVVTSGLRHSRFPAGLAVGRVSAARGRFVVQPFAPPGLVDVVKVLRWEPEP
jgi:rod shape-determining protein MreC